MKKTASYRLSIDPASDLSEASLAPLTPAHAEEFFSLLAKNRQHLAAWADLSETIGSVEDARQFLRMVEEDWAARRALSCGIFCQGRLIGYVGVLEINASRGRGELAFWIDESYVGQGVAYWATRAAAAVAFSRLNLRVLIINCHAQNLRARRLAQRLGAVAYRTAQTKVAYRLTARNLHDTNKG